MASLTGQTISTTYDSLLKLTDNGPITSSFKEITDGLGNSSGVFLISTGQIKLGNYTTTTSFTGTAAGYLAFDSSGNILTTAIPSGITGSGTTNTIPKFTGTSALGNSQIFDNATNVGIGTTSPSAILDIYRATSLESSLQLSSGTNYARLFFRDTDNNFGMFINGLTRWRFVSSNGNAALLESGSGNVAIGTTAATATTKLWVAGTGYFSDSVGIGTSTLTGYNLRIAKTLTGSVSPIGILVDSVIQSDATSTTAYFRSTSSTAAASFTTANINHYQASQGTIGAGSVVTNQNGFLAASTLIGATNNFGFRGSIPAQTGAWNLYMDGTANNYMAGSLGIGSTSIGGTTGYSGIRMQKQITGATTAWGMAIESSIQSDVTGTARIYSSNPTTQASAFTLTNLYHFAASSQTLGSTSAITTQAGFFAGSGLTTATNNYGFQGDIPSATGRWNLYMSGTANNYLAGNLGIGIAIPNAKLEVYVDANSFQGSQITNVNTGNIAGSVTNYYNGTVNQKFGAIGSGFTTYGVLAANDAFVYSVGGGIALAAEGSNSIKFGTGTSAPERMRINSSGNVLIGSATDNNTGAKLQVTGSITYQNTFNRQSGTSYTLVLTDQNDIVEMNNANANTLNVPTNASVAFPIGTEIQVLQYGVGQTTIAGAGVTLNSKSGQLKIANRFTGVTLVKVGTNEWYVIGNLSA